VEGDGTYRTKFMVPPLLIPYIARLYSVGIGAVMLAVLKLCRSVLLFVLIFVSLVVH